MQQLDCEACENRVLVEKYSQSHTSIQWLDDPESRCPEFRARAERGEHSMFVTSCGALQASVWQAVHEGRLSQAHRSTPVPGRLG
ncbi:hypothetical protein [Rhodococcus sp. NPDC058481]|uniref:hypothetical protein n=1 Tax=unclassified Rhodococcus (in: high G+C Gram-positive bacteria) TaxID=192944 RepID=UPI0036654B64